MNAFANPNTPHWRELDVAHHLHPFTDAKLLQREGGPRVLVRGEGVWLVDSEGNRLIDGLAGLWCVALGYGRAELADAAARQMRELAYANTFFKSAAPVTIELAARLAERTPPGLDHVFFASSGSEANDTIVRMARLFWKLEGRPEKRVVVSREFAYHGSTLIAQSAGGMPAMHSQSGVLPEFVHAMPPYAWAHGAGRSEDEFAAFAADAVERKILEVGADRVAAFFAEPLQGAGGVIVPPRGYWPRVQAICRRHDVLLVADEVITGFGRTGRWFGCEYFDIAPDFMTVAKAITSGYVPLSAAIVGARVAKRLMEDAGVFQHGFTYSGHPVACAVALENLRILRDERVIERVGERTAPYFQRRLREAFEGHPLVGEVRGAGLIAALELSPDPARRRPFEPVGRAGPRALARCLEHGLVVRAVRDAIALCPPLVITEDEIEALIARLRAALDDARRDLGMG